MDDDEKTTTTKPTTKRPKRPTKAAAAAAAAPPSRLGRSLTADHSLMVPGDRDEAACWRAAVALDPFVGRPVALTPDEAARIRRVLLDLAAPLARIALTTRRVARGRASPDTFLAYAHQVQAASAALSAVHVILSAAHAEHVKAAS